MANGFFDKPKKFTEDPVKPDPRTDDPELNTRSMIHNAYSSARSNADNEFDAVKKNNRFTPEGYADLASKLGMLRNQKSPGAEIGSSRIAGNIYSYDVAPALNGLIRLAANPGNQRRLDETANTEKDLGVMSHDKEKLAAAEKRYNANVDAIEAGKTNALINNQQSLDDRAYKSGENEKSRTHSAAENDKTRTARQDLQDDAQSHDSTTKGKTNTKSDVTKQRSFREEMMTMKSKLIESIEKTAQSMGGLEGLPREQQEYYYYLKEGSDPDAFGQKVLEYEKTGLSNDESYIKAYDELFGPKETESGTEFVGDSLLNP